MNQLVRVGVARKEARPEVQKKVMKYCLSQW